MEMKKIYCDWCGVEMDSGTLTLEFNNYELSEMDLCFDCEEELHKFILLKGKTPESRIIAKSPEPEPPKAIEPIVEPTPEPEASEPPRVIKVHRPRVKPIKKEPRKRFKPNNKPIKRPPRRPKYEPPDDNRGRIGKWLDRHATDR
jgi:hypothetical protein